MACNFCCLKKNQVKTAVKLGEKGGSGRLVSYLLKKKKKKKKEV